MEIKKRLLKKIIAIILVCIMVIGSSVTVFASTSYSGWKEKTVYGKSYKFRSVCLERYLTGGNTLEAVVEINTINNENVPVGYMGAQSFLCDENANLIENSALVYNSNLSSVHFAYSPSITASGYYYAFGLVKFYNGDGYTYDVSNQTPMASITGNGSQSEGISDSFIELDGDIKIPEMVPVKKPDGTTGFVRFQDISPEVNTIEEALECNKKAATDQIVPMYNEKGEIIGEWVIPAVKEEHLEEIMKELGY